MKSSWNLAVLVTLASMAPPAVAAPSPAEVGRALITARTQGCGGRSGVPGGWLKVPALDQAAGAVAAGRSADQAVRDAGYRARQLFQASFSGYTSAAALAQAMRTRYCDTLLDPQFNEWGMHQQGSSYWVLLAQRFDPPDASAADDVARRVLELVNQARASPRTCGGERFSAAPPLRLDARLSRAAQSHASDMARHSYLEHRGRDGSSPAQRATREAYDWRSVGENVAAGQTTAQEVVAGWLRSPGHCANIMQPHFVEMGIAFATNASSEAGIYWAQVLARPR